MFYHIKFDKTIGSILSRAGYQDNAAKFAVWPAGLSRHLIKQSKELDIKPVRAALLGLTKYLADSGADEKMIGATLAILRSAQMEAQQCGPEFDDVVSLIEKHIHTLSEHSGE